MDYEQFFSTYSFSQQCLPFAYVLTALTAFSVVTLSCMFDTQAEKKRIENLQEENDTLKGIILKSVDKMLVRILKNGYDIDNSNEE